MFSGSFYADSVDFTFAVVVGVVIFFVLLISFLLVYFVYKYNHKRHKQAKNIHGNTPLELTWTIIPLIIVIGIFYMGWINYDTLRNIPKDAMKVKVTGVMWKWSFEYPNGLQTDTLFVPINKPVKMEFISNDVNHSFYVPALRFKTDVIPSKTNTSWFQADELGSMQVQCAEYCGLNHSQMNTMVVVLTDSAYNQWFNEQTRKMQSNANDTTKISTN